jgi:DNA helicase II / ATP-dependent DNA helicase PcrA
MDVDQRLQQLWSRNGFTPNDAQRAAVLHVNGPLYLPAGPGSGKTRVLLWRTVNLIMVHDIDPARIFLATFTEKAAHQLAEGLRTLLGQASALTGRSYDVSALYVGTLHALAQRMLGDRRFSPAAERPAKVTLLDDLGQYLFLRRPLVWRSLLAAAGLSESAHEQLTDYLTGKPTAARHHAVEAVQTIFNRFSEECLTPTMIRERAGHPTLQQLAAMYEAYLALLQPVEGQQRADFALLQRRALDLIEASPAAGRYFQHVIVDEYQDTNTVQERIYFSLAAGSRNLCVVGDDDQAMYRFRGAVVENFVEFPQRCINRFGVAAQRIALAVNYRSRQRIVDAANRFVAAVDWRRRGGNGFYRITDKQIRAASNDRGPSVVVSRPAEPVLVADEIARLVRGLLDRQVVENANQIAFLFPSLQSVQVKRMRAALERLGLKIYAPRAGTFLDVEEAVRFFGMVLQIFGRPPAGEFGGSEYKQYQEWLDRCETRAAELLHADRSLAQFVADQRRELQRIQQDERTLTATVVMHGWDETAAISPTMLRALQQSPLLSAPARRALQSPYLQRIMRERQSEGRPFTLRYVLRRATALDWNLLDLFYRLGRFDAFKQPFDLAQSGEDEGPLANYRVISEYLGRFIDEYAAVLTAEQLQDGRFSQLFFLGYLYAIYRRGEHEYEDADNPFPRGRIPFLTIHQAKGLEFPVVVLGNLLKRDNGPQRAETIVRPLLARDGEPLDRIGKFDIMRMYYVALSRAQQLLVLAHYSGRGQQINAEFEQLIDELQIPSIAALDLRSVPRSRLQDRPVVQTYSFSADYLQYRQCPRQYMVFQQYGLVPSRTQTMIFGNLVHRTLEDLHQLLMSGRRPR